jgi:ATP-dependent helicase/nuclease subunit B
LRNNPECHSLFPYEDKKPSGIQAEQMAAALQKLREQLADGGFSISSIFEEHSEKLEEPERWQALATAEKLYLEAVSSRGYTDSVSRKIRMAETPNIPEGISRIVVAAVPDPSLLLIKALEALAGSVHIDILVPAPESEKSAFDGFGRPLPEAWTNKIITIDDDDLILCADGLHQAECVVSEAAREAARFGPGDIALGVPDKSVIPAVESALTAAGLPVFDPSEKSLRDHPATGLLASFGELADEKSYRALSRILRHPDLLAYLEVQGGINTKTLLRQLDKFQNRHLPVSLDDVKKFLAEDVGDSNDNAEHRPDFGELRKAVGLVSDLVDLLKNVAIDKAVRELLQKVYQKRLLSSANPDDKLFEAAAIKIADTLTELAECSANIPAGVDAFRLLRQALEEQTYHADPHDVRIDLEGWLELPWNDAPFMIVTGVNEGCVPDGRLSDMFMPDSLLDSLGLRSDRLRLARDAYIMTFLIESRRKNGRTIFMVGKTSSAGDPLRPSRLLFRCDDTQLAQRAQKLFAPVDRQHSLYAATVAFKLDPNLPVIPEDAFAHLRVTSFSAYLACPFRFYLTHGLGMRRFESAKAEPDALDFGTIVHFALQQMGLSAKMRKENDPKVLEAFLLEKVEEGFAERFPQPYTLPIRVALDSARQRLRYAAAAQAELAEDGWQIVEVEKSCSMKIGGIEISGTIDRIDIHEARGRVRILDYKTTDSASQPEDTHIKSGKDTTPEFMRMELSGKTKPTFKRWIDLQLPLYYWLLRTCLPDYADANIELAYFALPKSVDDTGIRVWQNLSPTVLDSAYSCAEAIVQKIAAREFWPPSEKVTYDDFEGLYTESITNNFEPLVVAAESVQVQS